MAIDWMQNLPDQQDNNLDFLNNLPDLEGLPDKGETPSFGSRIGEFSEGLLGFGKSLIESGFGNPMGMNPFINPNGIQAGKDIVSGMVLDPARELFTGHPLRAGAKFLGMNPDNIYNDYQAGNYGALAGDVIPQLGMGLVGARLAKGSKVKAPTKITDAIIPEVLPRETPVPPKIKPPIQLESGLADPVRNLLPARGETSVHAPQRFISGDLGTVDTSLIYPFDLRNQRFQELGGAALTPEDIAQIASVRPDLTPDAIMQMMGRRGTPEFINELGSRNPMDIATGEVGGNVAIGNPLDRAQLNPVFDALIPDRLKSANEMIGPEGPIGMRRPEVEAPKLEQKLGGRVVNAPEDLTISNYEPNRFDQVNQARPFQLPRNRAVDASDRPKISSALANEVKQVAKETGDSEPVLSEAVNSSNPAVKQAAYDYIREPEKSKYNPFRFLSFAGTELKGMGASGAELYRKASRFTQLERFNLKDWAEPYKNAVTKLSKKEQENFGAYVEGKLPIPNESVRTAVDSWRNAEQSAGKSAENVGMVIEDSAGNKVPFTRISRNYWPRRLSKDALEALPTKIDQMVAEGIKRSDAEKIVANARKFGELILPAQHKRASRLFEYRNDALSGLEHLENMARASARVQEFGRKDIAGHSDGILGLIENTSNPGRAYDIMKRIVGRDEKVNKNLDNFVRSARTAVSWLRLQNYGISSIIGNQLPNMLRANMGQYIKSLGGFVGRNRAITDHSAAAMDISHGVFEQTSKLNPMKVYGGNLSENIVRGQAAGIGQGMANTYFRELKKNPFNIDAKKQLFELILEDPDMLVNQPALTEPQLRMAAARSAELSQGLTNPVNLPMWASEPVSGFGTTLAQLMLIFKKQAAIQSKMLYDSFKRNPVKTMALAGGMSQLAGGAIGAIKSGIIAGTRSAVSGRDFGETFEHEFGNRADWVGRYTGTDNEIINGTIDRAIQSWALGSALDLAMLALEPKALGEFIAGPVVGAAGDIGGNITHPTQLGREAMRMLPIPGGIGTGLQRELLPTRSQEIE